ncbi:MAG TPA: cupin domain-containing protein [Candidatus Dormibacteraeota bacterium]|nr:cupin domain-containing protein [Candidatus Dormibacteraeota bacterium]
MKTKTYGSIADLRPYLIRAGMKARVLNGERAALAVIDIEPNGVAELHHHENEQLGLIIAGEVTFHIGGEERTLQVGDVYSIPSDVPHDAKAGPLGATVVDVFIPVRADWEELPRGDASTPDWPR